jgi:hypothetical protein
MIQSTTLALADPRTLVRLIDGEAALKLCTRCRKPYFAEIAYNIRFLMGA